MFLSTVYGQILKLKVYKSLTFIHGPVCYSSREEGETKLDSGCLTPKTIGIKLNE